MECPHCNKEFQTKAVFNHIRSKHPKDLIDSTNTKWCGEATQGNALKLVWWKKNDFDEEEDVTIYACLATNKTFTTEQRANLHFKKNPEHLKAHVSQLKRIMKEIELAKKAPKKNPLLLKYHEAKKNNCPILARILWRAINFHENGSSKIIKAAERLYTPEAILSYKMRSNTRFYEQHDTLDKWLHNLKCNIGRMLMLRDEKCLDVDQLEKLAIYFEEFNNNALPLIAGEIFDWMSCVTHEECIRAKLTDLQEELYYLAAPWWPGVDF